MSDPRAAPLADADAVVERTFERTGPAGAAVVRLALGRPEPDPEPGGDWRCRVVVSGLGRLVDQYAYGIDSLQALALALEMARALLAHAALRPGERLQWLGDADLGLPRVIAG